MKSITNNIIQPTEEPSLILAQHNSSYSSIATSDRSIRVAVARPYGIYDNVYHNEADTVSQAKEQARKTLSKGIRYNHHTPQKGLTLHKKHCQSNFGGKKVKGIS